MWLALPNHIWRQLTVCKMSFLSTYIHAISIHGFYISEFNFYTIHAISLMLSWWHWEGLNFDGLSMHELALQKSHFMNVHHTTRIAPYSWPHLFFCGWSRLWSSKWSIDYKQNRHSEGEDGQVENQLLSGMVITTSFSFSINSRCAYGTTCRINSRYHTITWRTWVT